MKINQVHCRKQVSDVLLLLQMLIPFRNRRGGFRKIDDNP
jgi:hypothetical protein